jgi:large subunit ribosomal protein L29
MKRHALNELRALTVTELEQKAKETKLELFNLRFALRTGHLTDVSKLREMRRSYAQILAIISEKRLRSDGAA